MRGIVAGFNIWAMASLLQTRLGDLFTFCLDFAHILNVFVQFLFSFCSDDEDEEDFEHEEQFTWWDFVTAYSFR